MDKEVNKLYELAIKVFECGQLNPDESFRLRNECIKVITDNPQPKKMFEWLLELKPVAEEIKNCKGELPGNE